MIVEIEKSKALGSVNAPASKSMGHRHLILGALSKNSIIRGVEYSEDIKASIACLKGLGCSVNTEGSTVTIGGLDIFNVPDDILLDCNESGSTLRFLIPLCLASGKKLSLTGRGRLMERPQDVYEKLCKEHGLLFERKGNVLTLCGPLKSGEYSVRGDISSQFITGLLCTLPLLEGDSILNIEGEMESLPYIKMTLKCLDDFGIRIFSDFDNGIFKIPGNQVCQDRDFSVEGDYSNAAFLESFNFFDGEVKVGNLPSDRLQGDSVYIEYFEELKKEGRILDISNCPDLGPILFALATKNGARFTGTRRLRIKESDRAMAMKEELLKFGCDITVNDNEVIVPKTVLKKPDVILNGHNDHRIVMALSVLCSVTGGRIGGAEAVRKSFPDFFERIKALGINVKEVIDEA